MGIEKMNPFSSKIAPLPPGGPGAPRAPGLLIEFVLSMIFLAAASTGLDRAPLSADEARYAYAAAHSWGELFAWLRTDNYPPLFFALFKLWAGAAGFAESMLRATSPPLGLAALIVFGLWARTALGPGTGRRALDSAGLLAIFLVSQSPGEILRLVQFALARLGEPSLAAAGKPS